MPFVSITRVRIRSFRFLLPFFADTHRALRQLRPAEGFLGGALLGDRRRSFWTMSLWRDEAAMRAFMTTGAHRATMPKLLDWCDQASVAHWVQDDATPPDWIEADRRMRSEGRPSRLRHPGHGHHDLAFAMPRVTRSLPIAPTRRSGTG